MNFHSFGYLTIILCIGLLCTSGFAEFPNGMTPGFSQTQFGGGQFGGGQFGGGQFGGGQFGGGQFGGGQFGGGQQGPKKGEEAGKKIEEFAKKQTEESNKFYEGIKSEAAKSADQFAATVKSLDVKSDTDEKLAKIMEGIPSLFETPKTDGGKGTPVDLFIKTQRENEEAMAKVRESLVDRQIAATQQGAQSAKATPTLAEKISSFQSNRLPAANDLAAAFREGQGAAFAAQKPTESPRTTAGIYNPPHQ